MIVRNNYVLRVNGKDNNGKRVYYDWFSVKYITSNNKNPLLGINMRHKVLLFPSEYAGKKIRLRVEVVDE